MFWFEIVCLNLDRYLVLTTVKQGYFYCLIDFHSFSKISVFKLTMGYYRKSPKMGVWEYGISRGIKEILWNFWGLIKNEVEFPRETKKNSPIPAFLYQVRRTSRFFFCNFFKLGFKIEMTLACKFAWNNDRSIKVTP